MRHAVVSIVVFAAVIAGLWTRPASSSGAGADCRPLALSVQVPAQHTLRGTVCGPAGPRRPRAALVLVHGSTYDRTYWDFPIDRSRYSALRLLAARGYLTLAIDRLGSGTSDRPPVEQVTADADAGALHHVVRRLREDTAMRTRSGKVFLIGHSSGSTVAIREAAQFDDVDGVVSTGFLHNLGAPGGEMFEPMLHPAAEDAKFRDDPSIPQGYVTTRPGVRVNFVYPFNADERVVDADEATKDAYPANDGFIEELLNATYSRQLDVPVLIVIGARDLFACLPPTCPEADAESGFYPASPDFQIIVRPRVGHNPNLHRDARETTNLIRRWADQHADGATRRPG